MAWTVAWKVFINGQDLTSAWAPVLIDIEVNDQDGTASDSCSLTIDDSGGQVRLPGKGDRLTVYLEGGKVFEGFIDQPQSTGSRGGGLLLKIKAKGFDSAGKAKELQSLHMDDATLADFLGKVAKNAGLTLLIDPAFGAITRSYWSAEGQSILALGDRFARKLGGTFKIRGDTAVLAKRGQGLTPNGAVLPAVAGIVGRNVISWTIAPRNPRRAFRSGSTKWFDRQTATFDAATLDFGSVEAVADTFTRATVADADEAEESNDASRRETAREDGGGSVELDLAIDAVAEGAFVLSGAKAGVDGTYRIVSVKHKASRSGGATTSLELKQPEGGAGHDTRH